MYRAKSPGFLMSTIGVFLLSFSCFYDMQELHRRLRKAYDGAPGFTGAWDAECTQTVVRLCGVSERSVLFFF